MGDPPVSSVSAINVKKKPPLEVQLYLEKGGNFKLSSQSRFTSILFDLREKLYV